MVPPCFMVTDVSFWVLLLLMGVAFIILERGFDWFGGGEGEYPVFLCLGLELVLPFDERLG